jgi:hypothetical protein
MDHPSSFKAPEPPKPVKTPEQLAEEKKAAEDAKAAEVAAKKASEEKAAADAKAAKEAEAKQVAAHKAAKEAEAKGEVEKAKKVELKKECLSKAHAILHEYGQESNIPLNNEYWGLMNQYRGL